MPTTDICLTVSSDSPGGSWTGHTSCPGITHVYPAAPTCSGEQVIGDTISITATPDTNFFVSNWEVTATGDSGFGVSDLNLSGNIHTSQSTNFIYNEALGDITIVISFLPIICQLTLAIGNGEGTLRLNFPSGKIPDINSGSATVSIDASAEDTTDIRCTATPAFGYTISGWELDGVTHPTSDSLKQTPNAFTTVGFSSRRIEVFFVPSVDCTQDKQLTVTISGQGVVSHPNGLYCDIDILNLAPSPANGWVFSKWIYDKNSDIDLLVGGILRVPMAIDRTNITAIFIEGTPVEVASNLFYCPSDSYKNNIVAFDFVNTNDDPSIDNNYHFRVNFYNDINKSKLVYSAFSLADNKRWFLDNDSFTQLSTDGLNVGQNESVSIVYDPEVLPQQISETQKPHLINDNTVIYEKPLICGIKYYVEIQSYEMSSNSIDEIMTISLTLACNRVDSYYWNYNKDKNNWLCSGQGKIDLKVCGGFGQAINPSIASNLIGNFQIVWQGRRFSQDADGVVSRIDNVYSAIWESGKDKLHSSGQGLYDALEMDEGNHPIVITDPALNFYITGTTKDNIKYKECTVSPGDETPDGGGTSNDTTFEAFCYPGETTLLSSVYDEIKMRIYKEDTSGSLVINDEKVVSVINKKSIRLDVDGIVGAYAVRVRNMEDPEWGEWINIDNELLNGGTGDDQNEAYRIDNNRFLVQWDIKNLNGLRRICCQVLTMYGISNTFCIEVLSNFEVPQHVFKFYVRDNDPRVEGVYDFDDPINSGDEFPLYNGQYVLSIANATVVTKDSDGNILSATVYFDAIFSDPVYKDETKKTAYEVIDGVSDVKFNFIQQGINDKRKVDFDAISTTGFKFSGKFEIFNSDGIFNRDGVSFIEIVFPGELVGESCGSDERDKYNFINADVQEVANIDLLPEEVYQKYQRDRLAKGIDLNEFKQNYDKDDVNFKFGDPGYYRK